MLPLGSPMPKFELKDAFGNLYASHELKGARGVLVFFTCNHCPYAQAVWPRIIRLASFGEKQGIHTVAINPNIHPDYPEDAPEAMETFISTMGFSFPYLVDESQEVAKAFQAQCTPDLYLYDSSGSLRYHGRIDDNWKDETKVTREELKEALVKLSKGEEISPFQKPSMGCSIKWRQPLET